MRIVNETEGLLQWVVIDPLKPETFKQADEILQLPKCVGIKIHPERHSYPILKHGRAIFEFAAKRRAVILSHSGNNNSIPGDFVQFVNDFPEVKLILAHLGHGHDLEPTHQVRAIQKSKHGNMFVDTSSSFSITSKVIEWAVREIGAERILFGTDTPEYFTPMHRARIDHAYIKDEEKRLILRDNAVKLLGLKARGLFPAKA